MSDGRGGAPTLMFDHHAAAVAGLGGNLPEHVAAAAAPGSLDNQHPRMAPFGPRECLDDIGPFAVAAMDAAHDRRLLRHNDPFSSLCYAIVR